VELPLGTADKLMILLLSCVILLLTVDSAVADFSGPIVSVLDGDTLEVLNGHHTERIRLSGIDCSEKAKPTATTPSTRPLTSPLGRT
jgi:endonuclease YncB( thermonuclease family)